LRVFDLREPSTVCAERHAQAPLFVKEKTRFVLADINDVDFLDLVSGIDYEVLLLFCNNLVFNPGTNTRSVPASRLLKMLALICVGF
jgi:hypothetical protein